MSIDEKELIDSVSVHECLYNNKINDYKHFQKKQQAWEDVSANLGAPVSECKAKWNQLRNAFLHALTRRNASKIFRRWKYENEMAFLVPFLSHGTWRGVLNRTGVELDHDCSGSQYSDECSNEETMSGMSGIKRKVECEKDEIEEKRQCIEEDGEYLNNGDETQKTDYYKEIFQLVKEKIKSRKKKDEIDLLFESLAQAVKLLPKSDQIELKVGITSLVYEAQLKHGT